MWVTLAKSTHQDTLCLAVSNPENPFSTCLVGVPLENWPCPSQAFHCKPMNPVHNVDFWDSIYAHLPQVAIEAQELELLGSLQMDAYVMFSYQRKDKTTGGQSQNVNATLDVDRNASWWCNYTSRHVSHAFDVSLRLPKGVFLICGDCSWVAIPSRRTGTPCSLGRLTLLTPNITMTHQNMRSKQSLRHKFILNVRMKWFFGDLLVLLLNQFLHLE